MYPVLSIGSLSIPAFGVMLAVGWCAVLLALRRQSRTHALSFSVLYGSTLTAFVAAVIGSRVLYAVIVEGTSSPAILVQFHRGTMYYGFLLGAAAGALLYLSLRKLEPFAVLDACIPAWLFMQISGRIGCFAAGCCYGIPTDLPWGVRFPHLQGAAPALLARHPTQLYEALGVALILRVLFVLDRRGTGPGVVTATYLLSYSVMRFLLEFLRDDPRGSAFSGALSSSQGVSIIVAPAAAVALWYFASRQSRHSIQPTRI